MERELRDAIRAGAIGFTTSRSPIHETPDARPVASRLATLGRSAAAGGRDGRAERGHLRARRRRRRPRARAIRACASTTCACATWPSRPAARSPGACSAGAGAPRCGATTWSCSTRRRRRAGGCSPRSTAARSTRCSRSRPRCRSTDLPIWKHVPRAAARRAAAAPARSRLAAQLVEAARRPRQRARSAPRRGRPLRVDLPVRPVRGPAPLGGRDRARARRSIRPRR